MEAVATLLCTVGTSLLYPNLSGLGAPDAHPDDPPRRALAAAYQARRWPAVARALAAFAPTERLLGAEINSVALLEADGVVGPETAVVFFHSATADGRAIADTLTAYFGAGGRRARAVEVADLVDDDPECFASRGLPALAEAVGRALDAGPAPVALDATGGFKAVVAVAVATGLARGVPVYYKHERFDAVIRIPPLAHLVRGQCRKEGFREDDRG